MISGDDADRERGDDLLRASDRRIENFLESITDEFFALDREWRYTYINERGLRHIQIVKGEELTREGLLGKNVWELFPEHVGSVFYQKYHEALREQKTVHFEAPSPVRETWFEAHVYPSEEGLAIYCRDITERKRAEETLQRSEREYHNLFELANDAILVYEPESRVILDVNDNACEMYGIPKEKLVGTAMRELSQDHQRARRYLEALLREGSYQGFETVHRRADGTLIEVVVNSSVIAFRGQRAILSINRDVTRSKRMEASLREAETRYRTLVEQVPAAIYIQQPGEPSTTTYISPQIEAMQGYTPREIIENPEHWTRTLHPDDRERVLAEDARTNETGEPFKMEYRQFANDGRVVWVRDEAALVRDEEGGPLYWQGVLLDVTERKLAEEQLLFQAHLLDQVKAAVIATDMHGTVTHWNEHAEKLYLWSREEALGRNIAQLTVGPTEAEVAERIMERLRAGETWEGEFVVNRKDGFTFSAYVTDSLIRDADGNAVGIVGVSTDITELKRTEEELKESEERFRAFFETAAVGASQADPTTGRFLQVNEKLCRFLGYGRAELLSMTYPDVTHPDDRAHDLEGISHLLLGETHEYTTEKRYVRKDGQTVWGQVAVSLVKDAAGRALQAIAVTQDISARKAAEEALLEIREAERRRIARELHDVVLQDLAGVLQGLQATQVESEASTHATDLRPEIEALRTAVGSLRNAIFDLRLEGKQTFVRAVESLVELNRQLAPEREITLTVQDGFPPELPDGMDVEVLRVLREALANIRRHADARRVEVVLSNGRDRARVEVTDDGRGFDAASIRAGVGFSGMRERASEIGGELEVESGPGQGTRVKVEFPL